MATAEGAFTIQVVVLLAVGVSEGVELLQQQRVLQNPLDGFDQVRLQSGRMLLAGVPLGQEGLELGIGFGCKSRNISVAQKMQNYIQTTQLCLGDSRQLEQHCSVLR